MSVTNDIKYKNSIENKQFIQFLENHAPVKTDYHSMRGLKPFDSKLDLIVRGNDEVSSSGYIGSISELYIDLIITKHTQNMNWFNLHFECVTELIDMLTSDKDARYMVELLKYNYSILLDFISAKKVDKVILIQALCNMDRLIGMPIYSFQSGERHLHMSFDEIYTAVFSTLVKPHIIREVLGIGNVFVEFFINENVLKTTSDVVICPDWGIWGEVMGAFGDLYIDGTIYDLKSRKMPGYRASESMQVYAYYLCTELCNKYDISRSIKRQYEAVVKELKMKEEDMITPISNMEGKKVDSIALYYSRYGDINKCSLKDNMISEIELEKLIPILIPADNQIFEYKYKRR